MIDPEAMRAARVLVIDDDRSNLRLMQRMLERAGYEQVTVEHDPTAAEAAIATLNPDLILLDLRMPEIDGYTLLERLGRQRSIDHYVPVLVLTGDDSDEAKQAALTAGAADFLTKPFGRAELLARIRNLLTTRLLHHQLQEKKEQAEEALAQRMRAEQDAEEHRRARRAEIEGIIQEGAITMVFQPIVELASGHIVGAEALARFAAEPARAPNLWFEQADEVGLGVELELVAVRAALDALDTLPPGVDLTLNASPRTVQSVAFASLLSRQLVPERLVIELTEHSLIVDYADLADALRVLRDLGIRLAVDDAGAGYASLRHILTLQPDIIKLDRTLITNLPLDSVRRALVRALVLFADEIGAVIVGEGIETEAEYTALRELGVGLGQGYHIARPAALPLPRTLDHLPATASP